MEKFSSNCAHCAEDGYCDFEYGPFDNAPTAQNDDGECCNGVTDDCDEFDEEC